MKQDEKELWLTWNESATDAIFLANQVIKKSGASYRYADITKMLVEMLGIAAEARQMVTDRDFELTMAKRLYEAPGSNADQRRLAKYDRFKDDEIELHKVRQELSYIKAAIEMLRTVQEYTLKVATP